MAELCEATGADVTQLADAIGHDARIGRRFLNAGVGFGGGCLPKDIRAFMARAGELGVDQALSFLREVDSINMRRRVRMVDLAREVCGGSIVGRRIAVLGAAFKPHSDDIRDSPALSVAAQMQLQGAQVTVTDPQAIDKVLRKQNGAAVLGEIVPVLQNVTDWNDDEIEKAIAAYCQEKQLGLGKVAQPIRVALTGRTISPGVFDMMDILGSEETFARLGDCARLAATAP
jgi:nucleotide sugar dehydrogenase